MNEVNLQIGGERFDGPENEQCGAVFVQYDPNDPASLQRAREAVKKRFSLTYLPVLCNEPEPSFLEKLFRKWFGSRVQKNHSTAAMARQAKQLA